MNQKDLLEKRVIIEVIGGVVFAGKLISVLNINNEESYVIQTNDNASLGIWCSCKDTRRIESVPLKE